MKVAIASGKGGTGKTTVAAGLTQVWDRPVTAMDLDVEEPNLHLFLKPEIIGRVNAVLEVPLVDETKCTHCRLCADLCQFKAISVLGNVLLTFPEMCHGCGGCLAVCPEQALIPGERLLGEISWGSAGQASFLMGLLRVGEAMSPPLMRRVKHKLDQWLTERNGDVIVDAPPGVSCPAVNAVMDNDVIVLVTEPTPFGLYDLKLAVEAFKPLNQPLGVVVNRAGSGDQAVYEYCRQAHLPILLEIPFDRRIAEAYAVGRVIVEVTSVLRDLMRDLMVKIRNLSSGSPGRSMANHV